MTSTRREYPERYLFDNHAAHDEAVEAWARTLTDGEIRGIAGRIAGSIIETARSSDRPIAWLTGNSYFPAFRSFTEAEHVWDAQYYVEAEIFPFLVEEVERHLDKAEVLMAQPDYDNALFAVDMKRWTCTFADYPCVDDMNDEWESIEEVDELEAVYG